MNFNFRFYWSLFLRRLPVMLAFFLICSGVGAVMALKLPETYSTTARLSVEKPQIQSGTANFETASEKLDIIREQILRRANMIDIAIRFNVLEDRESMTPDDVVRHMRENTKIITRSGRGQADLMNIIFSARTGKIAADVVNEYVTLALEIDKARGLTEAEARLRFFEQQVEQYSTELDQQSARIVQFKNENACCLPDDLNYRTGRLTLLQERQSRTDRDIASVRSRREEIRTIFNRTGSISDDQPLTPDQTELRNLERELERLKIIYSETNPRVRNLESQAAILRNRIQEASTSGLSEEAADPETALLDVTLGDLDQQLAFLEEDKAALEAEITEIETSIAATATNAIALDTLERDRDNIQRLYDDAVRSMSKARENVQIQVNSQGQEISVIENASVPSAPSGPNRARVAAMGVIAGLGLAVGYFMLLELLNRSIRRPAEIRSKFGIIPIATIPYMETKRQKLWRRSVLVSSFVAVLIGVPLLLWAINQFYMPLDILAARVLNKIGVS